MMPVIALKSAIRSHLLADTDLVAMLGGPQVFDEAPRQASAPYIVFADTETRENGTVLDRGHVTDITLHLWSRQGGSKQAWSIANRVALLLDDVPLVLDGHRLTTFRVTSADQRRAPEKELTRLRLKLRATTEVIEPEM